MKHIKFKHCYIQLENFCFVKIIKRRFFFSLYGSWTYSICNYKFKKCLWNLLPLGAQCYWFVHPWLMYKMYSVKERVCQQIKSEYLKTTKKKTTLAKWLIVKDKETFSNDVKDKAEQVICPCVPLVLPLESFCVKPNTHSETDRSKNGLISLPCANLSSYT